MQKKITNTLLVSVSDYIFYTSGNCGDDRMSTETLIISVVQDVNSRGSYSIIYKDFPVFPHFSFARVQCSPTVLMSLTKTSFKPTGHEYQS